MRKNAPVFLQSGKVYTVTVDIFRGKKYNQLTEDCGSIMIREVMELKNSQKGVCGY